MNIIRYQSDSGPIRVGLQHDGATRRLTGITSLAQLWALRSDELRDLLQRNDGEVETGPVQLLAPVDGRTEVWAAGVTYEISREARVEESTHAADAYELVYEAERPELFFKSAAWRVRGPDDAIAARADSEVDVPEPELALVVNQFGEIVGYTICNDVSSRTIEGENPLYLPQAKVYYAACALGPGIRPAWEIDDPYALDIAMSVTRDGQEHWQGRTSTSLLHRKLEELVQYLMRSDEHPDGVVLSTGTCLVPPPPFTLTAGDIVRIEIDDIGVLSNPVLRGRPEAGA